MFNLELDYYVFMKDGKIGCPEYSKKATCLLPYHKEKHLHLPPERKASPCRVYNFEGKLIRVE